MNYKTCLIEINIEDIPANQIRKVAKYFYQNIIQELNTNQIKFYSINLFYTPRRIAIKINNIQTKIIKKKITIKGPSIKNAFDEKKNITEPTIKWLKKYNIKINQTKILKQYNNEWLFYENNKKIKLENILYKIILDKIKKIYFKKPMKWNNHDIKFIRPIRHILILLNNKMIPFNHFGLSSKKIVYGNIITNFKKIKINNAKEYEHILYKKGKVITKFDLRIKKIEYQIKKILNKLKSKIKKNCNLIQEISCLIEFPKVLYGQFKNKFLKLPENILVHIMQHIQKYLPIYNHNNQLTSYFIIISNTNSKDIANIIIGNERVLNAKLSDVNFFFNHDRNIKLKEYFPLLQKIIFHEQLGTIFDKTNRLVTIMKYITKYTTSNLEENIRSTYLSKCDLKTKMVYEFPELAGIIGMNYSLYDGETKNTSLAIKEHYQPKFSGDILPSSFTGCLLSIIDKIDTITGLFLINRIPTQDKDPFGLRRLSIGIIRIIIEKKINLNLKNLIIKSIQSYNLIKKKNTVLEPITKFILNRLYIWYKNKKYKNEILQSVFSNNHNNILKIDKKINLLHQVIQKTEFQTLISTYKRIHNLLKINKSNSINNQINYQLIQNESEKKLFIQIHNIYYLSKNILYTQKYKKFLKYLIQLNNPVKDFLDQNSIKYTNKEIKINRINVLKKAKKLFLMMTDFNKL